MRSYLGKLVFLHDAVNVDIVEVVGSSPIAFTRKSPEDCLDCRCQFKVVQTGVFFRWRIRTLGNKKFRKARWTLERVLPVRIRNHLATSHDVNVASGFVMAFLPMIS